MNSTQNTNYKSANCSRVNYSRMYTFYLNQKWWYKKFIFWRSSSFFGDFLIHTFYLSQKWWYQKIYFLNFQVLFRGFCNLFNQLLTKISQFSHTELMILLFPALRGYPTSDFEKIDFYCIYENISWRFPIDPNKIDSDYSVKTEESDLLEILQAGLFST